MPSTRAKRSDGKEGEKEKKEKEPTKKGKDKRKNKGKKPEESDAPSGVDHDIKDTDKNQLASGGKAKPTEGGSSGKAPLASERGAGGEVPPPRFKYADLTAYDGKSDVDNYWSYAVDYACAVGDAARPLMMVDGKLVPDLGADLVFRPDFAPGVCVKFSEKVRNALQVWRTTNRIGGPLSAQQLRTFLFTTYRSPSAEADAREEMAHLQQGELTLRDYIMRFDEVTARLINLGEAPSPATLTHDFMAKLSARLRPTVVAQRPQSLEEAKKIAAAVDGALRRETNEIKTAIPTPVVQAASISAIRCFRCGGPGHVKAECTLRRKLHGTGGRQLGVRTVRDEGRAEGPPARRRRTFTRVAPEAHDWRAEDDAFDEQGDLYENRTIAREGVDRA